MNFLKLALAAAALLGLANISCEKHSFDETKRLYSHGHHDESHGTEADSKHPDKKSEPKKPSAKKPAKSKRSVPKNKGIAKDVGI